MLLFDRGASLATCIQSGIVSAALTVSVTSVCQLPKPTPIAHTTKPTPRAVLATAEVKPQPAAIAVPTRLVDCAVEPCLALTFDDGPDIRTTPHLLDTLAAYQVKATFFMLGSQVAKYPDLARRVERAGHEVGNHSWGHGDFSKLQPVQMVEDISHTQATFVSSGLSQPRLFRPPYGVHTPAVQHTVPMTLVYWNIDPQDWNAKDPAQLAAAVVASAKPGGIIVLHDIKPVTVAAAAQFLAALKPHYNLVTVSTLMGLTPDSPKSEIFSRPAR